MPLSEDEERILNQIERTLYEQDPGSAQRMSTATLGRYLARNCWWSALGFLGGLVVLLVGFSSSWVVGVAGFAVMTASAIVFTRNLRRVSRHGWEQLTGRARSASAGGVSEPVAQRARRWGRRFRRGDTDT